MYDCKGFDGSTLRRSFPPQVRHYNIAVIATKHNYSSDNTIPAISATYYTTYPRHTPTNPCPSFVLIHTDDDDADEVADDGKTEDQPTTTTDTTIIATADTKKSPSSPSKNKRQAPVPAVAPGKEEEGEGKNLDVTMRRKRQRTQRKWMGMSEAE